MTSTTDNLSAEDKEFLDKCEAELKDRYTEKDEEFMKIFNADPVTPPIIESWWVPQNSGRRNNRRYQPYERNANRDRDFNERRDHRDHNRRDNYDRRGYSDYNSGGGQQGYRQKRPRYY